MPGDPKQVLSGALSNQVISAMVILISESTILTSLTKPRSTDTNATVLFDERLLHTQEHYEKIYTSLHRFTKEVSGVP